MPAFVLAAEASPQMKVLGENHQPIFHVVILRLRIVSLLINFHIQDMSWKNNQAKLSTFFANHLLIEQILCFIEKKLQSVEVLSISREHNVKRIEIRYCGWMYYQVANVTALQFFHGSIGTGYGAETAPELVPDSLLIAIDMGNHKPCKHKLFF